MAKRSRYSVHPSVQMVVDWMATLKQKTGRDINEWMEHICKNGPPTEAERRAWLTATYGHGTNTAWWLAERASVSPNGFAEESPETYLKQADKYVDEQYAGKKSSLRPIFEKLLHLCLSVGKDAKACPCKTIVPLFRSHVFAQIKPSTNTRVDLGLALAKLPESKISKRLIDTGGKAKKDRITHRIPLGGVKEIDAAVEKWLRTAYDLDK